MSKIATSLEELECSFRCYMASSQEMVAHFDEFARLAESQKMGHLTLGNEREKSWCEFEGWSQLEAVYKREVPPSSAIKFGR